MGGVFAPIFTTDVLGYNYMFDWLPADLSFDWGSFLGGATASAAAVGLFLIQRKMDRGENQKRKLSHLREFCSQAEVVIELMTEYRASSESVDSVDASAILGGGGAVRIISEHHEKWDNLDAVKKEELRAYSYEAVSFFEEEYERAYQKYERVVVAGDASPEVTTKWLEIVKEFEAIGVHIRSVKGNLDEHRWSSRYRDADCKSAVDGVKELYDEIRKVKDMLSSLKKLCD